MTIHSKGQEVQIWWPGRVWNSARFGKYFPFRLDHRRICLAAGRQVAGVLSAGNLMGELAHVSIFCCSFPPRRNMVSATICTWRPMLSVRVPEPPQISCADVPGSRLLVSSKAPQRSSLHGWTFLSSVRVL